MGHWPQGVPLRRSVLHGRRSRGHGWSGRPARSISRAEVPYEHHLNLLLRDPIYHVLQMCVVQDIEHIVRTGDEYASEVRRAPSPLGLPLNVCCCASPCDIAPNESHQHWRTNKP